MEKSKNRISEKTANDLIKVFDEHKKATKNFSKVVNNLIDNVVFRHRKN